MSDIAAFESWPIQNESLQTLYRRIQTDTIPHAMLFVGDREETVRLTEYLEKLLLCTAPGAPCGVCDSCRMAGEHPDAVRVEVGDSGTVKTAQIEEIQERLSRKSHGGGRLVYTVPAVDAMTGVAANRLLKTLEEPAPGVFALLTAANLRQVLPTILSRCFVFDVPNLDKQLPWEDAPPTLPVNAGEEAEEPWFAAHSKRVVQWTEMLLVRHEEPLLLADSLLQEASDGGVDAVLWLLSAYLRDVAHYKMEGHQHLKFSEFKDTLAKHAKVVSIQSLYRAIQIVLETRTRIKSHVAVNLNIEQMCIRLREVLHRV